MSTPIQLGIIKAIKGSVQKRIINVDGKPLKDANHNLNISHGVATSLTVDGLEGVAKVIQNLGTDRALTLGIPNEAGVVEVRTKNEVEQLNDAHSKKIISRSKEFYDWPDGTHLILLDHDPEPGQPSLNADEFWNELIHCVPELKNCGRLVTVSTSSGIYDKATGKCLKPADGHHTFIMVRGDVEKLVELLEVRLWLGGQGFHKLSAANKQTGVANILKRNLIDFTVFSRERLVYEAGAILPEEFEQRRPAPHVEPGGVLNIKRLPIPSRRERRKVNRLIEKSRAPLESQRLQFVTERIQTEQDGLSGQTLHEMARQLIAASDYGVLAADHVLYLANGQTITAGEIGPEHHGQTLCDPLEPTYRGGRSDVAKIYCGEFGNWTICSFAHGFHKYRPAEDDSDESANILTSLKQIARKARSAKAGGGVEKRPPKTMSVVDISFDQGGRKGAIAEARKLNYKHILDISGTGAGKSTSVGRFKPEQFGVSKLFYLTSESRNPSTVAIEQNYVTMPVRHGGMVKDEEQRTPLGNPVLRHPKEGEVPQTSETCIQPEMFTKLSEKGVNVEGSENPVCASCSQRDTCKVLSGMFKNDRRVAMESDRIRSHPQSLSSVGAYDYSNDIAFWDEAGSIFHYRKEIRVYLSDIEKSMADLALEKPRLFKGLRPTLKMLRRMMTGDVEAPSIYGWNDTDLAEELPDWSDAKLDKFIYRSQKYYERLNDYGFLDDINGVETSEETKEISSIRAKIKRRIKKYDKIKLELDNTQNQVDLYDLASGLLDLTDDAAAAIARQQLQKLSAQVDELDTEIDELRFQLETLMDERKADIRAARAFYQEKNANTLEKLSSVQKRWLVDFLRVMAGDDGYSFRLRGEELTLSIPEPRYIDIANAFNTNVYLDATLTRERLAMMLKCDPADICVIEQIDRPANKKPNNLTIIQVRDMGRVGRQRSDTLSNRISALTAELQSKFENLAIIDYKSEGTEHYWFRDNRASNAMKEAPALLLIGTPCPNLASLEADYISLTGNRPSGEEDEEWQAFVTDAIDIEYVQAVGRLRANLRPDEDLYCYILSNHAIPAEMDAELVHARTITMDAASAAEQAWASISKFCVQHFETFQQLPKQLDIESILGIAQGQISKLAARFVGGWKHLKKIFHSLLDPHKANGIFLELPPDKQSEVLETAEVVARVTQKSPRSIPTLLIELTKTLGAEQIELAIAQLNFKMRDRLLKKLLLAGDFV